MLKFDELGDVGDVGEDDVVGDVQLQERGRLELPRRRRQIPRARELGYLSRRGRRGRRPLRSRSRQTRNQRMTLAGKRRMALLKIGQRRSWPGNAALKRQL